MKNAFALIGILLFATAFGATRTEAIREKLMSGDRSYVFVAMHRGDWRNFPENSKGAILSSIRLGADIVELDVPIAHIGHGKKGYLAFSESVIPGYLNMEPRRASMYEMCFNDPTYVRKSLDALKSAPGAPRIWVNTLWDSLSANHSDFAALTDPDANWGWWLERGVTMIQSDYAAEMIVYLIQKGRRNL